MSGWPVADNMDTPGADLNSDGARSPEGLTQVSELALNRSATLYYLDPRDKTGLPDGPSAHLHARCPLCFPHHMDRDRKLA